MHGNIPRVMEETFIFKKRGGKMFHPHLYHLARLWRLRIARRTPTSGRGRVLRKPNTITTSVIKSAFFRFIFGTSVTIIGHVGGCSLRPVHVLLHIRVDSAPFG